MIKKQNLEKLYKSGLSMMEIANRTGCNYKKVVYWMQKCKIPRRSWSEATYMKRNPNGDPFKIKILKSEKDFELFNLGIGLYLGEGDKRDTSQIKLANTNPKILNIFLKFLRDICNVQESKINTELNIFDDIDLQKALAFWQRKTDLKRSQLKNSQIRKSRGGSYKNKSKYGTLTIYVCNTKLKKIINRWCKGTLKNYYKPR